MSGDRSRPIRVAFLWHMHQPEYRDLSTGIALLPWVRLHALRNYADFPALLGERPGVRHTINLTPVLLDQVEALGSDVAGDLWLRMARKPASDLLPAERQQIVEHFFSIHWEREILPHPRYRDLLSRRGSTPAHFRAAAGAFSEGDLRDLVVWFHLAWSGNLLREDPLVRGLREKGRDFTEEEKDALLALQDGFIRGIVERYRDLPNAELTTTPRTHPILPLLIDTDAARPSMPHAPLPRRFQAPHRAAEHVRRALESHRRRFGRPAAGMWPAEGSVSDAAIDLMAGGGVRWTATDRAVLEGTLGGSLRSDAHLRAWRVGGRTAPLLFFRDTALSDRIGFTYATWGAERAAEDLLNGIRECARAAGGAVDRTVVPVILDGENAWEYYEENGRPFLRELFRRLDEDGEIRAVTFAEALDEGVETWDLGGLRPGSWVGGDFRCWVGHPEKNRAWELLAAAPPCAAAEGSDWFWWYGDDHPSYHALQFDEIFRSHLRQAWREAGRTPPPELDSSVRGIEPPQDRPPSGPVSPVVDGKIGDYLEWLAAGVALLATGRSSLHPGLQPAERIRYGWGDGTLSLLLESTRGPVRALLSEMPIVLEFAHGSVRIFREAGDPPEVLRTEGLAVHAAAGEVLEVTLPAPPAPWLRVRFGTLPEIGVELKPRGDGEDWIV